MLSLNQQARQSSLSFFPLSLWSIRKVVKYVSDLHWLSDVSVSLCPALFCTPRPNLPVTPRISWLPTFAFQPPIMKRACFFFWGGRGVLVLKGLVGLHRTFNFSVFCVTGQGIDLYYHDIELPWKRTEIILSFLRLHPSTAFWTLLLTMMATPFLLRDSCLQ